MPKIGRRIIRCDCGCRQPDQGRRQTCERCGMAPLPSYSYPVGHVSHPDTVVTTARQGAAAQQRRIEEEVDARRAGLVRIPGRARPRR